MKSFSITHFYVVQLTFLAEKEERERELKEMRSAARAQGSGLTRRWNSNTNLTEEQNSSEGSPGNYKQLSFTLFLMVHCTNFAHLLTLVPEAKMEAAAVPKPVYIITVAHMSATSLARTETRRRKKKGNTAFVSKNRHSVVLRKPYRPAIFPPFLTLLYPLNTFILFYLSMRLKRVFSSRF